MYHVSHVNEAFSDVQCSLVWVVFVISLLSVVVQATEVFRGQVVGVLDGDTLQVLRQGKAVKVRLHGIDTPEKAQAYGTRARQFTSDMVFKREVVVVHATDRYGRLVGEVVLPAGRSLNQELVRPGLAWWYRQYAPRARVQAHLEAEARAARHGLWADSSPLAPWDWRKGKQSGRRAAPVKVAPTQTCCKVCRQGKACGDGCIPQQAQCVRPAGCACGG